MERERSFPDTKLADLLFIEKVGSCLLSRKFNAPKIISEQFASKQKLLTSHQHFK